MTETTRTAPESETPVNPYSLLEAVNASSDMAHTAWLIFLAIMAYLMIAVAGVTHKDLLLETPVELPILQVPIQLPQFFQFAPVILVLFHLGLISQLVLLARKTLELDHAIRLLETSNRRTHPLRLELHNFFFVQAVAGPHRSHVVSAFLHGMSWLTLVVLPVVLILYIQIMFLPYHDVTITWMHRIALLIDILVLVLIGIFLTRIEASFFHAFWRTTLAHPFSFTATFMMLGAIAVFSLFVATVPGETLDHISQAVISKKKDEAGAQRYSSGFIVPFFSAGQNDPLFGVFLKNIVVTDTDLVVDKKDAAPGEPTLNLRNRDLRFAKLDRSDLHGADFTGANLDDASLVETDLRETAIACDSIDELRKSGNRDVSHCPSARRADFTRAKLPLATLFGADLSSAIFEGAHLNGADMRDSILRDTVFSQAVLDKADISGAVQAQGVDFSFASLKGVDLRNGRLQAADFTAAKMQGVVLFQASLHAANLSGADLEAATLAQAQLQGADLAGVNVTGADMRDVRIWVTKPPQPDPLALLDLSGMTFAPLKNVSQNEREALERMMVDPKISTTVKEAMQSLMDGGDAKDWSSSPESQEWRALTAQAQPPDVGTFETRLTEYLTALICKAKHGDGALATGVARRAQVVGPEDPMAFRGDVITLYDRLKQESCPAFRSIFPQVMYDLAQTADALRN